MERGQAVRRGSSVIRRIFVAVGTIGFGILSVSLYLSWSHLTIVSFGPAELASIAKRDLLLRYGAGLLAAGGLWLWGWLLAVKRDRVRRHRFPPGSGRGGSTTRPARRGAVHSG